jgi:hypothetical protein
MESRVGSKKGKEDKKRQKAIFASLPFLLSFTAQN